MFVSAQRTRNLSFRFFLVDATCTHVAELLENSLRFIGTRCPSVNVDQPRFDVGLRNRRNSFAMPQTQSHCSVLLSIGQRFARTERKRRRRKAMCFNSVAHCRPSPFRLVSVAPTLRADIRRWKCPHFSCANFPFRSRCRGRRLQR